MDVSRRTIWRFYAYRVSVSNGFWLPVGILYLQRVKGFGLGDIGLVMGGFSVAMVLAEIPTGYVGDRFGRRTSLLLGNVVIAVFMAAHTVFQTPLQYLGLYVFWSFGWAFRSGTADAWLYELLDEAGESGEFTRIRGRASSVQFTVEAVTAIAAGGLIVYGWSLPFLANAAVATAGIPLLLTMPPTAGGSVDRNTPRTSDTDDRQDTTEDTTATSQETDSEVTGTDDSTAVDDTSLTVGEAIETLRVQLTRPNLRWFVAYSALFSGFYQVAREFEQPALDAAGVPLVGMGVVYAGFKLVSAAATSTAGWLSDRYGPRTIFAMLIPVYATLFLGTVLVPLVAVPVLAINRSLGVLMGPIRSQYVNDRVGDTGRATVLSGVSMVLVLTGGVAKLFAGVVAEWIGLFTFLAAGGFAVALVGGVLWLTVAPVGLRMGEAGPDDAPAGGPHSGDPETVSSS